MKRRLVRYLIPLAAAAMLPLMLTSGASAAPARTAAPARPAVGAYGVYSLYPEGDPDFWYWVPSVYENAPWEVTYASSDGGLLVPTAGTWQELIDFSTWDESPEYCAAWNNSLFAVVDQVCNGATYQLWRSVQNPDGSWYIWNEWYLDNYGTACWDDENAVISLNEDNGWFLECPTTGGTYGGNQRLVLTYEGPSGGIGS